jgi:predicted MFS family arabinose efflux permease
VLSTPRLLSETPRHTGRRLPDPVGAGMFAGAAAAVSLALSETSTWGVASVRTLGTLGAGIALTVAFVGRSRRVTEPMLDLTLLRNRRVLAAAVVAACYAAAFFGFLLTFMLFAVDHWQMGLVRAGAAVLLPGLVVVALTTHVGRVAERLGHRTLLTVGAGLMASALLACAATLDGVGFEARWLVIGPVLGVGIGLCYPVLAGAAVHGLAAGDLAAATAINQCARQLGAAIGVAAAVGVLGHGQIPDLAHFHAVWLVGALFSVAAGAAAWLIPQVTASTCAGTAPVTAPGPAPMTPEETSR